MTWLTAAGAAKYLGISTRHLRRLVVKGEIVDYRIGKSGRPRYRQEDIDRLLTMTVTRSNANTSLRDFISARG